MANRKLPPIFVGSKKFNDNILKIYNILIKKIPNHIGWTYKTHGSHGLSIDFIFNDNIILDISENGYPFGIKNGNKYITLDPGQGIKDFIDILISLLEPTGYSSF